MLNIHLILLFALDTIRIAAQRAISGGLIITKFSFGKPGSLSNESKKRSKKLSSAFIVYITPLNCCQASTIG